VTGPSWLDEAEAALDDGDLATTLDLCRQALARDPDDPDAHYLAAEAYRDLGETEEAEGAYRQVVRLRPDHAPAFSGLATVLFDQIRFDEARTACLRALRADDGHAEAYYLRALLRERRGDARGARRDYRRAHALDPQGFPMPLTLDESTIEAVVTDVLLSLHPAIRTYLAQVVFLLEDVPSADLCLEFDPPAPPAELLGVFSGATMAEQRAIDSWGGLPASITLFRRNLERIAWDRDRLLEELRITVFHEVGHFLGLDEDDLRERGLD
jgi:predicted Zn-dependent protease with MMP-like domain